MGNRLTPLASTNISCYDASKENLTDHWKVLYHPDFGTGKTATGPLIMLFLTGVPLNLYIITAILYKRLYTQPTYLLLLNLGIIHLITCFIPILFGIVTGLRGEVWFGSNDYFRCQLCKLTAGYLLAAFAQMFNITLLSLERLAFFLSPLHYISITYKKTAIVLVFMWLLSIVLTIPPILGYGDMSFAMWCGSIFVAQPHVDRSIGYFSVCAVVSFIFMTVLHVSNIGIVIIAIKSVCKLKAHSTPQISYKTTKQYRDRHMLSRYTAKKQLRFFQIYGILLLVNVLSTLPAISLLVIAIVSPTIVKPAFVIFVLFGQLTQVALHPAIETSIAPELRKVFLTHFSFCCPTKLHDTAVWRCISAAYEKLGNCCRPGRWTKALENEIIVNVYDEFEYSLEPDIRAGHSYSTGMVSAASPSSN